MRRRFMSNVNSFDIDNYLTFKAGENYTPLAITFSGGDIEYCVDGSGEWITLPNGSQTAFVDSGHTISFRANLNPVKDDGIGHFGVVYPVSFSLSGNCMSLLYGDNAASYDAVPEYAFHGLFSGLRVTSVSKNLLPATILSYRCYWMMFRLCSFLTTAPELPATTLTSQCYYCMFEGCDRLNYIKMLATDISARQCLYNWVNGVASSGTFVKNSAMTSLPTAISSNSYVGIPSGWTVVNDGEESGGNLITFTIDGTEYQAEEGMTWGEWVDSEYNVDGYLNYNSLIVNSSVSRNVCAPGTGSVFSGDMIKYYTTYKNERFIPNSGGAA